MIERSLWRRHSAACSKQTRDNSVGTEAFVDRQKEGSWEIGDGRVAKGEDRVETSAQRHTLKATPEGIRSVRKTNGNRRGKRRKD